jgi:hypothetical protein
MQPKELTINGYCYQYPGLGKEQMMSSRTAREKWNAAHLSHINIAIDKTLAEDFKTACKRDGVSVAGTLTSFMKERLGITAEPQSTQASRARTDTRTHRRKQVLSIIIALENIRDAEEAYLDRIPENLQDSIRSEIAEHSISMLSDAIDILCDAY